MLKLIINQANWSIIGTIFGFSVGFFVKIYLIDIVGLQSWGKYVIAQTFSSFFETFLSLGIPFVIIKFLPNFYKTDLKKAERTANIFLKYAIIIGSVFVGFVYLTSDFINYYIYNNISDLDWILFIMCIHVPISMLFGVIISLYRSVLKIKELVLYGTFVSVSIRAILTFVVFHFTSSISHFIFIEILTQIIVLFILLYLFNKNEFRIFVRSDTNEIINDTKIVNYGKKMFYHSIIAFISSSALNFIISIKLPTSEVGAYNILVTLTGLSTFLLLNLNKVFAPAISKLFYEKKMMELNILYKKTTFLVNILTVPLIIILLIFADEILALYTYQMLKYKTHLFLMITGGLLSIAAGSSGTFMIMAGLENYNLKIQFFKSIMIILLALILIPLFGMISVVFLYVFFMIFINILQLYFINKNLKINPFSFDLFYLFILTGVGIYFAVNQNYNFSFIHFILIPLLVYFLYFLLMVKPLARLLKELK